MIIYAEEKGKVIVHEVPSFMKADWSDYPSDIGHFTFRGCMGCHDGKLASSSGTAIPNDCRTCHVIIAQVPKMA